MPKYRLQITFNADDDEDASDLVTEALAPALRQEAANARDLEIGDLDEVRARWEYARSVKAPGMA
jgi:hypothetical protein